MRRGNTPGTGEGSAPYMYRGKATLTRVASDDTRTAVAGMLTLAGSIVYNVIRSGNASPTREGERDFRATGSFVADAPLPAGFSPSTRVPTSGYALTWEDAPGAAERPCRVKSEGDERAVRVELRRS